MASFQHLREQLRTLGRDDLSRLEHRLMSTAGRFWLRQLRIFLHVTKRMVQGRHNERAAALTYLSLLSLVPMLAVVFSLFKAFGGFDKVLAQAQDFLLNYLAPDSQEQVSAWLAQFLASFNAGAVGVVGMAALLVSLMLTLSSIEDAFNRTWAVTTPRGWGMRIIVYWTLLTVGPLLLGTSIAITAGLESNSGVVWFYQHLPAFLFGVIKRLLPIVATAVAFTVIYLVLPSARVKVSAAITGGVTAAILFELAKVLYTVYARRSIATNALYGSLAAIPIFMIWVNYSWRVVLLGADLAHASHYVSTDPSEETDPRTNQANREEAAVRICAAVSRAFAAGGPPLTVEALTRQLLLPAHLIETLCHHLTAHGLVRETPTAQDTALVPARPLEELTVADVIDMLRRRIGVSHWSISDDNEDEIDHLLMSAEEKAMATLKQTTWAMLAQGKPAPGAGEKV